MMTIDNGDEWERTDDDYTFMDNTEEEDDEDLDEGSMLYDRYNPQLRKERVQRAKKVRDGKYIIYKVAPDRSNGRNRKYYLAQFNGKYVWTTHSERALYWSDFLKADNKAAQFDAHTMQYVMGANVHSSKQNKERQWNMETPRQGF